jgi:hypothetical protein
LAEACPNEWGERNVPNKKELIDQILAIELEMFLSVPTAEKAGCQSYPEKFRLHRKVQFEVWSEPTLKSYLNDLKAAQKNDINLMTIKYARMENLIDQENLNPLISEIVSIQFNWQMEMFQKYPHLMAGARPLSQSDDSLFITSFETYLKGELETYSEKTLTLLYRDMTSKKEAGINMSAEVYDALAKELGYNSIEEADLGQK